MIVTFRVATGRMDKDSAGNLWEDTEWTNITCWNKLAEVAQDYLRKGSRLYVEGRLQTRSWEDQATGQKPYWTEVVAQDIIFLDRRQEVSASEGEAEQRVPPPAQPGPATKRSGFVPGVTPRTRMQTMTPTDKETDDLPV